MENYSIGTSFIKKRAFNLEEVLIFAKLSEDFNAIHVDEQYAKETNFGKPIVHGILALSVFSSILASELPGPGSIYLKQEARFLAPLFHDIEYFFKVEIKDIRIDKPIITLSTICYDIDNVEIISGEAVVLKR